MRNGFLTADQERELLTQYRRTGSTTACDRVVLAHMPLVRKMVSRVRISGIEHEDLIQDGVIGLMEAIKRFDPDRGIRFATYATWWIKAAITEAAVRSPTVRGSAASAGKRAFWKIGHGLISSLDAPAGDNGDLTFADLLIDETIVPADEIADIKRSGQKLANAVSRLPARQREIICSRYERDETLQVVADRAGVSKERIRQIQSAALASLKAELEPT